MAASTGWRVTETQATPNPNALKYVLDRPISDNPLSFFTAASASGHPIASKLFAISGVTTLLLLNDFVTVNKSLEKSWGEITPQVKRVLAAAQ